MAVKDFTQALVHHPVESAPERREAGMSSGVRIVSHGNTDRLEIVASPASKYLLPELAGFSLVRKETRAPGRGEVIFYGGDVVIDAVARNDDEVVRFQDWLEAPRGQFVWTDPIESTGGDEVGELLGGVVAERGAVARPDEKGILLLDEAPSGVIQIPGGEPDALQNEPLSPDASVKEIAAQIHQLTGLSDEDLARLFKVTRETFNRWRTGVLTNPTPGSRRRLGLLLRLLEDLNGRDVGIKDWLLNSPVIDELTAYELLESGRISEVAYLAAGLGGGEGYGHQQAEEEAEEELVFGEDDQWEVVELEGDDDAE